MSSVFLLSKQQTFVKDVFIGNIPFGALTLVQGDIWPTDNVPFILIGSLLEEGNR